MSGGTLMSKDNSSWITRRRLPKKVVDIIEQESYKVPWYFFPDCAYPADTAAKHDMVFNPYFSHSLTLGKMKDERTKLFPLDFITQFCLKKNCDMLRSHITFQWPRPEKFGIPHNAHTDNEKPHDVVLYYVNDSDGDTFFFDNEMNVIHREIPERGKLVIFDGSTLHASSSPSKNFRLSLNINYERA